MTSFSYLLAMLRRRRYRRRVRLPFRSHRRIRRTFHRRRLHFRRKFRSRKGYQDFWVRSTGDAKASTAFQLIVSFNAFPELAFVKSSYEAYRILSVRCKITPLANTSSAESPQDHYASAPYHRLIDNADKLSVSKLLTLDKGREYHGNATSTRHFVPAIEVATSTTYNKDLDKEKSLLILASLQYRPRIEIRNEDCFSIPHYCGLYCFGKGTGYQVTISARIRMYNQKISTL